MHSFLNIGLVTLWMWVLKVKIGEDLGFKSGEWDRILVTSSNGEWLCFILVDLVEGIYRINLINCLKIQQYRVVLSYHIIYHIIGITVKMNAMSLNGTAKEKNIKTKKDWTED